MNTGKTHMAMLSMSLVAILLTLIAQACGSGQPSPEEVAKKIDAKEQLTQADYSSILDYCAEYAKKAQEYTDIINSQPNDTTAEYTRAVNDAAGLFAKYPYLDMFRTVINNLPESALDKDNLNKVKSNAKYMAFPLPVGAGVKLANPDVEGDIVDMPDSDSNGVVATGDGEAVEVQVK